MSEMWTKKKVKNGFMRGKQRYKCKNCGCNYTVGKKSYPKHVKQKAINITLKGMDSEGLKGLYMLVTYQ